MVTRKYLRHSLDSDFGSGFSYVELVDGRPTRQVEVYGSTWYWSDAAQLHDLADRPLEEAGLRSPRTIDADEFERVWREARERRPPRP